MEGWVNRVWEELCSTVVPVGGSVVQFSPAMVPGSFPGWAPSCEGGDYWFPGFRRHSNV